jgi:hypothetical protein
MNTLLPLAEWVSTLTPSERQTLAYLWHLPDPTALLSQLTTPAVVEQLLATLRPTDRAALERILAADGQIAAAALERDYGTIRPHTGFINPRAYLNALQGVQSAVERLFVLGLIQPLRTQPGVVYAIPTELRPLLPNVAPPDRTPTFVVCAPPADLQAADPFRFERELVTMIALAYAEPLALNNNGTLHRASLARLAARLSVAGATTTSEARGPAVALLRTLARDLGLLHQRACTLRVARRALEWLAQPPAERFTSLLNAWLASAFDELTLLCGLRWRTPPWRYPRRTARRAILDLLTAAPEEWLEIAAVVAEVRRINPDFARTGAEYDAWQLSDADGARVTGWANWERVEGALIKSYLLGPLHWLGVVDLGGDAEPTLVRLGAWGAALAGLSDPPAVFEDRLQLQADGTIYVAAAVPPMPHFQVNRIATWQGVDAQGIEEYAITLRSFDEATERGIGREQIVEFLRRWSDRPLDSGLIATLGEWEQRRTALRGRTAVLLEASDPALLASIAADSQVRLPPYTVLNPTTWALEPADGPRFIGALRDHGYGLAAALTNPELPLSERDLRTLLVAANVIFALGSAQGWDHGVTEALLERVRRTLPANARAEAERLTQELIELLKRAAE